MSNRLALIACIAAIGVGARGDDEDRLHAVPFVFVGEAGDCGPGYPPGSNIVTSAWLRGMGLPDKSDQQLNTTVLDTASSKGAASRRDPHSGLLLNKNGPTADCSSAGATIHGAKGLRVDGTFVLGFDYRNGTHCGAGSPRLSWRARAATTPRFTSSAGARTASRRLRRRIRPNGRASGLRTARLRRSHPSRPAATSRASI